MKLSNFGSLSKQYKLRKKLFQIVRASFSPMETSIYKTKGGQRSHENSYLLSI